LDDFLGFAIHRTDLASGKEGFLPNFLRCAANDHPDGPVGSDRNPLQAFQCAAISTLALSAEARRRWLPAVVGLVGT
jgi:hypothetical protein